MVVSLIVGVFVLIVLVSSVVFPYIGRVLSGEKGSSRFQIRVKDGKVTVLGRAFRIAEARVAELIEVEKLAIDSVQFRGTVKKGKIQLCITDVTGTAVMQPEAITQLIRLLARYHVDVPRPTDGSDEAKEEDSQ